ncbi:hypothetical protein [Faecalibacterium sp.]|uniref:hypothetical protein n=1 Tax=Faecalibacterium sp. TaxID=1971605 RepID=UPI003A950DBB
MKYKFNLMAIIAGLIFFAIGLFLALMDAFVWDSPTAIVSNIGCSLLASAVVALITALLVDRRKENPLDEWKISKIYSTRAEKNADSDPELERARYQVDAVAFGLSNFRNKYENKVEICLKKGVNFRILTMNPESEFVAAREREENTAPNQIKKSIEDLVAWADKLNAKNYKGKIIVKGYNCMTLDFYWRVDGEVFVGPYWYGQLSNQTITYAFADGGKGFQQYSNYFEKLWDNSTLSAPLTEVEKIRVSRKRKH